MDADTYVWVLIDGFTAALVVWGTTWVVLWFWVLLWRCLRGLRN